MPDGDSPAPRSVNIDNRISLQKLEVFCLVVELGSVSRAAERLYVTQPVVSAHLHTLQERVGVALFRREGRSIELTEAGRAVHGWAQETLSRRKDLGQELDDLATGTVGAVALGASMSIGNHVLPPLLIDFRRRHPGAIISLTISVPELAIEAVRSWRSDFCVVASTGALDVDVLTSELIGHQRLVLVAAPTDDTVGDSVTVDELRELSWVCPPQGVAIRRSQDSNLAAIGVTKRRVAMELGSGEAMKQAVQAKLGVALLWEASVAADVASGTLREIKIDAPEMRDSLFIVKHGGKWLTPLQQKLYDEMLQMRDADGLAPPRH